MIDARNQIAEALLTVCSNVLATKPEDEEEFPLICFSCVENLPVNMANVRLKWRIAVYSNDFDELLNLENDVNAVMSTLGYTLTSSTPDDQKKKGTDFYLSRMDFSALVDLAQMGVIKYSK